MTTGLSKCICFFAAGVFLTEGACGASVCEFGAVGDGVTKNTAAIQAAIDRVAAAGGGRVEIPSGRFVTGSVYLKDGIELHLEKGAVLLGSPDRSDYNAPDVCPQNTTNASESSFGAHLILAIERKNVSITGEGTIDGNCEAFLYGPRVVYDQQRIPWRPSQMIFLVECDGVRLDSFNIRHAPYWSCYLLGCRDVEVKGLTIRQRRYPHTHNGDGLDIDTCEHVRISDCDILASDDALTLRACASRLKRKMECRDVVVRNCRLSSACTGVRLGVGDGVIRDCDLKGLRIWRTRSAFDYVSSWSRKSPGTEFRNITISDVELEAVIFLTMRRNFGAPDRAFDGLVFRNVKGTTEMSSDVFAGTAPGGEFGTVVFEDVDVGQGVEIRGVRNPVIRGGALRRLCLTEEQRKANTDYYKRRHREYWHRTDGTRPNPVRVAEIAASLPEQPGFPGDHISNRARWAKEALGKSELQRIKSAAKLLAAPVPACSAEAYRAWASNEYMKSRHLDGDERYGGSRRAQNLSALMLAECAENKGRYLPKIVEYLEAAVTQPSWAWAPHDKGLGNLTGERYSIELGSSEFVLQLAVALDRLRGKLPEDTVKRVRDEIEKRAFSVYRAYNEGTRKPDSWWNGRGNWTAVCHGNTVQAALRIVEDRTARAAYLEAAERGLRHYLDSFLDDGTCTEGQGYWNYGFGHYLSLVLAFREFTGGEVDLALDPLVRRAMEFPKRYALSAREAPRFGDSGKPVDPLQLRKGAKIWPDFEPKMPSPMPIRDYLPSAQVLVCRPKAASGLAVAFKGGSNGYPHNHNDIGSYDIRLGGEPMAGDVGAMAYTKKMFGRNRYDYKLVGSYGHPVPLIGELQQFAGMEAEATVLSTDFTDARDEIVFDLSPAYRGLKPGSVVRTCTYDREKAQISIVDRITLEKAEVVEFPVVTDNEVRDGASRGELSIVARTGATLQARLSVEGTDWEIRRETIENPHRPSVTRLAARTAKPVTSVVSSVLFSSN